MTPKPKHWPAWRDNPRPPSIPSSTNSLRRLTKLRQLAAQCTQDADGRYHLPGSTFRMTIAPEMERRLMGMNAPVLAQFMTT